MNFPPIPQPSRALVIARYWEDVNWVYRVKDWDLFLYNKGELMVGLDSIPLPNVGREAGTYLHHIVEHYDRLADQTAFVQGHPFDHNPSLLEELHGFCGSGSFFVFNNHGHPLTERGLLRCDLTGGPDHKGLPLREFAWRNGMPIFSDHLLFTPGAQFIVSRERIRKRPHVFYKELLKDSTDPLACYLLERLWPLIFGPVDAAPFA